MAKVKLGAIAGQVSGSIGTQTWSRNRYGAYIRNRSIPVNTQTLFTQESKSILAAASQAWGSLNFDEQQAWRTWANNNPVIDRLGDQQTLAGNAAFNKLACRVLRQGGAMPTLPPVGSPPEALATLSGTADIGAGDFEIVWTPTPLATGVHLWTWVAVVDSLGVQYVRNRYKLVNISAAAATSPLDLQSDIEGRFGTLQVGQVLHFLVSTTDANGLQSIGFPLVLQVTST